MDQNAAEKPALEKQFVKELAERNYEAEVLKATLPVVLEFYASESASCTALAPRFGAVAEKFDGKVQFLKILKKNGEALATKLAVTASPTLIFFKSGKEAGERLTGDDIKRTALKAHVEGLLK